MHQLSFLSVLSVVWIYDSQECSLTVEIWLNHHDSARTSPRPNRRKERHILLQDALRGQRLPWFQWPPIDRELHDAAHKVVTLHLAPPLEDGVQWVYAPHCDSVWLNIQGPMREKKTGMKDEGFLQAFLPALISCSSLCDSMKISVGSQKNSTMGRALVLYLAILGLIPSTPYPSPTRVMLGVTPECRVRYNP